MTGTIASLPAICRRAAAVVLAASFLLSISCEKKMARTVSPDRVATFIAGGGGVGVDQALVEAAPASRDQSDTLSTRKLIRNGSSWEISLRADADAAVAGIQGRRLRPAKIAVSEIISGLADWVDSVIAYLINLPLIGVWLISNVILVLVAGRIRRFLWASLDLRHPGDGLGDARLRWIRRALLSKPGSGMAIVQRWRFRHHCP